MFTFSTEVRTYLGGGCGEALVQANVEHRRLVRRPSPLRRCRAWTPNSVPLRRLVRSSGCCHGPAVLVNVPPCDTNPVGVQRLVRYPPSRTVGRLWARPNHTRGTRATTPAHSSGLRTQFRYACRRVAGDGLACHAAGGTNSAALTPRDGAQEISHATALTHENVGGTTAPGVGESGQERRGNVVCGRPSGPQTFHRDSSNSTARPLSHVRPCFRREEGAARLGRGCRPSAFRRLFECRAWRLPVAFRRSPSCRHLCALRHKQFVPIVPQLYERYKRAAFSERKTGRPTTPCRSGGHSSVTGFASPRLCGSTLRPLLGREKRHALFSPPTRGRLFRSNRPRLGLGKRPLGGPFRRRVPIEYSAGLPERAVSGGGGEGGEQIVDANGGPRWRCASRPQTGRRRRSRCGHLHIHDPKRFVRVR